MADLLPGQRVRPHAATSPLHIGVVQRTVRDGAVVLWSWDGGETWTDELVWGWWDLEVADG